MSLADFTVWNLPSLSQGCWFWGGSMETVQLGVHSGVVCLNGYLLSAPSLQGFMLLGV